MSFETCSLQIWTQFHLRLVPILFLIPRSVPGVFIVLPSLCLLCIFCVASSELFPSDLLCSARPLVSLDLCLFQFFFCMSLLCRGCLFWTLVETCFCILMQESDSFYTFTLFSATQALETISTSNHHSISH